MEYLICRNTTVPGNSCLTEQFAKLKFFHSIRKLILGIFSFSILVYHNFSTSSFGLFVCGELIIPKIRCYFNVNAPFVTVILLEKSSIYASYTGGKVELFRFFFNKKSLIHLPSSLFFKVADNPMDFNHNSVSGQLTP